MRLNDFRAEATCKREDAAGFCAAAGLARHRERTPALGHAGSQICATCDYRIEWRFVHAPMQGASTAAGARRAPHWAAGRHSEGVNEFRVPERVAKTQPIKAPGADLARATASIGNAERVRVGGQGGHVGFVHTFSSPAPAPVRAHASPGG